MARCEYQLHLNSKRLYNLTFVKSQWLWIKPRNSHYLCIIYDSIPSVSFERLKNSFQSFIYKTNKNFNLNKAGILVKVVISWGRYWSLWLKFPSCRELNKCLCTRNKNGMQKNVRSLPNDLANILGIYVAICQMGKYVSFFLFNLQLH